MTELESKVQSRAMRIVRDYDGYVYKNPQNMYTEKGRPDLTACVPVKVSKLMQMVGPDAEVGLFVGLEIKRDHTKYDATEAQRIVGRQIKRAGGLWLAIDDTDIVEALMIRLRGEKSDAI